MLKKLLSRDEILKADDRKIVDMSVPEWGGNVRIRMISASEREEYSLMLVRKENGKFVETNDNIRAKLVSFCLVDEKGNRLFSKSDVVALSGKCDVVIRRIYKKAQELNKLVEGVEDETAKN